MKIRMSLLAATVAVIAPVAGDARAADGFDIVSLGALGGIQDGNLSANLIRPHDDERGRKPAGADGLDWTAAARARGARRPAQRVGYGGRGPCCRPV